MMYGLITILWINGSGDEEGLNTIMETVKYDLLNFIKKLYLVPIFSHILLNIFANVLLSRNSSKGHRPKER